MKFSAQILTEELRFDGFDNTTSSSSESPVHFFESDSMSFTIEIRPRSAKRARQSLVHQFNKISENEVTENFGSKTTKKVAAKDPKMTKFSPSTAEAEPGRAGHRQEEEEIRRKLQLRKPSRKISREGDYLVVQDKMGIKLTQAGTMQIKEVRCKIGSEEYFDFINKL